ncbi:hypothetical protein Q9L58_009657 [Maublancomyces gigas]|uniref:Rhodopsin domain-containing protein n=1 Tax=Discina gigas TaxID=1032678 RepID=A0ABR3G6A4_9PEZI
MPEPHNATSTIEVSVSPDRAGAIPSWFSWFRFVKHDALIPAIRARYNLYKDRGIDGTYPPTRAHIVLGGILPLHSLMLLMVGARILVKSKLGKLGIDDFLIVCAMIIAMGMIACTILLTKYGFGMHISDFRTEWQLTYGIIYYVAVAIGNPCAVLIKTSMICFYLHLSPHPTFRIICYLSIGIIMVYSTVILALNLFGCAPISGGWNRSPDFPSKCITTPAFYRASVLCNLATDMLVMLLPIPILMRMQLELKTKLGLVIMFTMGFCTTAASGACFHSLEIIFSSTDITWDGAYTWFWTLLEINAGMMTACMPSMMLFWRWVKGENQKPDVIGAGGGVGQASTIGGGGGKKGPRVGVLDSLGSEQMVGEVYVLNDVGGCMEEVERDGSKI